jgi:hypothetical protein
MATGRIKHFLGAFTSDLAAAAFVTTEGWCVTDMVGMIAYDLSPGLTYYNTSTGTLRVWDGFVWEDPAAFWSIFTIIDGDLAAQVATAGVNERTFLIYKNETLTANLTVPENITLWCARAGAVTVTAPAVLRIEGEVESATRRIFTCASGGVLLTGAAALHAQPEWFGAARDGATNDTAAMQTTVMSLPNGGRIVLSDGTYLLNGQIFVPYNVSITSEHWRAGVLYLNADLKTLVGDAWGYWLNFGIASKGSAGTYYSGVVEGVTLRVGVAAKTAMLIEYWSADGFAFHDNHIDMTGMLGTEQISCVATTNNASYCNANAWKYRGEYSNNKVECLQIALSANTNVFSVGPNAEDFRVTDNYMRGNDDDCVGIHHGTHVIVTGNQAYTIHGRWLLEGGRDIIIANNYLERIADAAGTWGLNGEFVRVNTYGNATGHVCADVIIADNIFYQPPQGMSEYGIRLFSGRRILIRDNEVRNDAKNYLPKISVAYETPDPAWVDPDGIETGHVAHSREITICGNQMTGIYPAGIRILDGGNPLNSPGPYHIEGNTAGAYASVGRTLFGGNAITPFPITFTHAIPAGGDGAFSTDNYLRGVTTGARGRILEVIDNTHTSVYMVMGVFSAAENLAETTTGLIGGDTGDVALASAAATVPPFESSGATSCEAKFVAELTGTMAAAGATYNLVRSNGLDTAVYANTPTWLAYLDVDLSAAIAAGGVTLNVKRNGVMVVSFVHTATEGIRARHGTATTDLDALWQAGDRLEVDAVTNGGYLPLGTRIIVRVYAVEHQIL